MSDPSTKMVSKTAAKEFEKDKIVQQIMFRN